MASKYRMPSDLKKILEDSLDEFDADYYHSGCAGATPEYRMSVPGFGWITFATRTPIEKIWPPLPLVFTVDRVAGPFWAQPDGTITNLADGSWWTREDIETLGGPVSRMVPGPTESVKLPYGHTTEDDDLIVVDVAKVEAGRDYARLQLDVPAESINDQTPGRIRVTVYLDSATVAEVTNALQAADRLAQAAS